ncbi:MAG TPA: hypothetical protein VJ876_07560 [Bacteroidales bacterium]|nr:hypothetical protein [Bacteroidales bacterium]
MKLRNLVIALMGMLLIFTACEDDPQDNEATLSLGFKAAESTSTLKATDTLSLDTALIGIEEIELESEEEMENDSLEGDDDNEREYEFEGSYQVDLLAGTKLSELAQIEPGIYHELEAEVAPVLDNGYSVYITGRYTNSTGQTNDLIYRTRESIEFEVENEQGIQVNNQELKELIIRIDLNQLFSQVDLESATLDENNRILITEEHNPEMAEAILNFLDSVSEMEEDDDDDDGDDDDDK